jgi:tetratricopeptide (TPR) repeat protein
MRWLEWNSGEFTQRVAVASWLAEKGRHAESERLWEEANQVDPFRRHLHLGWGQALAALGRHAEALREFRVGLAVSVELDGDVQSPSTDGLTQGERAGIAGLSPEEWDSLSPEERQGKLEEALRRHATDGADGRAEVMRARFAAEEPLLHGHAALALVALGRGAEAHDELERALVLDPACAPALAARARLEEGVSRAGG